MKLKIKAKFRDKYTDVLYKIDDVIEFEEERAKELLADSRNLVEKVVEKVEKKPAKKKASEE